MFDFFFKRAPKPDVAPKSPSQAQSKVQSQAQAKQAAEATNASQAMRDAARAQAAALGQDEDATVTFLLACEFADARLIAAQSIQSADALQRVLKALRNTDRRVARLMQSRLDTLQVQQQSNALAQQCIADATTLATQPQLTPQQVGDLDRRWSALSTVTPALQNDFAAHRATLAQRLAQQVTLQRGVIDTLAALQRLADSATQSSAEDLQAAWQRYDADIAQYAADAEAINLPKNLLDQCRVAAYHARATVDAALQRSAQHAALASQLQAWEAAPLDTLEPAVLQREWRLGSTGIADDDALSVRFTSMLERVKSSKPVAAVRPPAATASASTSTASSSTKDVSDALQALDQALTQGQLQHALDADRRLRALFTSVPESASHKASLTALRVRLSQLQGWARWGGNVSREELQKAALALPAQNLNVVELAKKIGNLRAQWKGMDSSAGPASQELWHSFDAACTAAYAPVAAHHQVLAEARQKNSEAANQHIAMLEQTADQLETTTAPNWKTIAQLCQRAQQDWQRLGPTERRDKRTLDQRFHAALQRLLQPLAQVQKAEQQQREQLIATVTQLRSDDAGALSTLRALQTQWQERANAVLLDRREEQALWLRFRAACDAVFAQRKEQATADDRQRQENLRVREVLCSSLENIGEQPAGALTTLLRETAAAWRTAGAVPRAAQDAIDNRYRQACDIVKKNIDNMQRAQAQAQQQILLRKLQLCQQLDALLVAQSDVPSDQLDALTNAWNALSASNTALDTVLTRRFEQALQAHRNADPAYAYSVTANTQTLHTELTRLEIVLSLPSPPEHARERLKLQVDVLQSALRDGPRADDSTARLAKLCALPVVLDAANAARFERVLMRLLNVE